MPVQSEATIQIAERTRRAAPRVRADVSVVVVNFRQPDHVQRLCRQLDRCDALRSQSAEVLIVDNDADPQSLHDWATRRPGVRWRGTGRNRGFARAVNAGVRRTSGEWILLLNPDVSVPDEFLDQVLASAEHRRERDPKLGIIGFGLRHADGTPQASAGPFPTFANVLAGLLRPRESRRCRPVHHQPARVDWVTGCCLLVRRDCWDALDGCDEDFFLYYEDVDLCRRAHAAGWSVWHDPTLAVTHFHPLHSRPIRPALRVITRHALLTYARKHWPNWQFRTLGRIVRAEAGVRGLAADREHYRRLAEVAELLLADRATRARHLLAASARSLDES